MWSVAVVFVLPGNAQPSSCEQAFKLLLKLQHDDSLSRRADQSPSLTCFSILMSSCCSATISIKRMFSNPDSLFAWPPRTSSHPTAFANVRTSTHSPPKSAPPPPTSGRNSASHPHPEASRQSAQTSVASVSSYSPTRSPQPVMGCWNLHHTRIRFQRQTTRLPVVP